MTEPSDIDDDSGTPRWVKVFGIIALVVLAGLVVLQLAGGGGRGPARHMSGATPLFTDGAVTVGQG